MSATMSEADWLSRVISYAERQGWMVCHFRSARTANGWRTPVQGQPGCPDLILARDGVVLLAELKAQQGRATPGQRAWLAAAGGNGYLWKPSQWLEVQHTLCRPTVRVVR